MATDSLIPITITTNLLITKEAVQEKLNLLQKTLEYNDDVDIHSIMSDLQDMMRETKEVFTTTNKGKSTTTRTENVEEDIEVEIPFDDFMEAVDTAGSEGDVLEYCLANWDNDYFFDHLLHEQDPRVVKPLAENMNDYDFRRSMCDLFQTGYHVPSIELIKLFTQRIDKEWLILL